MNMSRAVRLNVLLLNTHTFTEIYSNLYVQKFLDMTNFTYYPILIGV